MRIGFLAVLLVATSAFGQVRIEEPWTRATPPGARVGAGYLRVVNAGAADRLVGATSAAAEKVELHVILKEGDVMRMREVKAYDIPARGSFTLEPGGAHLMLIDLKAPLKEGSKVPVVLRFEKAGEVKTELQVRPLGATTGSHRQHKH